MQSLDASLLERVHDLMVAHTRCELLSTTGLRATVDELVIRNRGLEQALHEIALEVQKLTELREQ